ncbi:MAG: 5'-methylthioadenosine phosphorylase, partial [Candidatus Marinamargulisbacteria bacterium]
QYPEVVLARELEMCYVSISLITDYDSGFEGERPSVTVEDALKAFRDNTDKLKGAMFDLIDRIDVSSACACHTALKTAQFS